MLANTQLVQRCSSRAAPSGAGATVAQGRPSWGAALSRGACIEASTCFRRHSGVGCEMERAGAQAKRRRFWLWRRQFLTHQAAPSPHPASRQERSSNVDERRSQANKMERKPREGGCRPECAGADQLAAPAFFPPWLHSVLEHFPRRVNFQYSHFSPWCRLHR